MGLEKKFKKGGEILFKMFKEAVREGTFHSIVSTGFEETDTSSTIRIIEETFSEDDIKYLSFSEFIQPNDVKGLVLGVDLPAEIHSQRDKIDVKQKDGLTSKTYTVVDFTRDPLCVLYIFLLRKT